jgi:hypothetical protein
MDRTNAERQRRYIQRLKDKASAAASGVHPQPRGGKQLEGVSERIKAGVTNTPDDDALPEKLKGECWFCAKHNTELQPICDECLRSREAAVQSAELVQELAAAKRRILHLEQRLKEKAPVTNGKDREEITALREHIKRLKDKAAAAAASQERDPEEAARLHRLIAQLRRSMSRNPVVMGVCDALEQRLNPPPRSGH